MILFSFILYAAHFQAIFFPLFFGYKSINKFRHLKNSNLISWGFASIGIASLFEMIDHTTTSWVYINHTTIFNWLFYSFLSTGLTFLSISVIKNKYYISTNLITCLLAISSYWLWGKPYALIFQAVISLLLIINWQRKFRDWLFIAYPFFGIFLTTFLGTRLSLSNNQIWHIFIGPSGTISAFIFFLVLSRSEEKYKKNKIKDFYYTK